MPQPANLVHELSASTGTGNFTLTAQNGKQRFSTAFGTGATPNVFDYFISNQDAAEWERGTGHMSAVGTLVRDTVLESTNANAAVNFSVGTKDVTNDVPAGNQVRIENTGIIPLPTGASISWNNGDVTITHSANALSFAGATNGYSFDDDISQRRRKGLFTDEATSKPNVVTISIASPCVISWIGHGLLVGDTFRLKTTGALPTGLAPATTYFVLATGFTANAFQIATSAGGTPINTSGGQSGVQTAYIVGVNITRIERLFVGDACDNTGAIVSADDWLSARIGLSTGTSEAAIVARHGKQALTVALRSIDNDQTPNNSIACSLYNFNDNTAFSNDSWGLYIESQRSASAGFTTCIELAPVEFGTTVSINPYTSSYAGATSGLWNASGGGETSPNDVSVGIALINNNGQFQKGIMFGDDSIDGTNGVTGTGTAIALAKGHKLDWFYTGGTIGFSLYSDVNASGDEQFVIVNSTGIHFQNNSNIDNFSISKVSGTVTGGLAVIGSTTASPSINAVGTATDIDINIVPKGAGKLNTVAQLHTGLGASTEDCIIEIGGERSGDGNAYIDFHAQASVDFNARLIRLSGVNGLLQLTNLGTGGIQFNAANASAVTQFLRNGVEDFRSDGGGINLATGKTLRVNGVQVVTARQTGWTAWTGTALRTTAVAGGATTVAQMSGAIKALIDDLIAHGLIGT